MRDRIRMIQLTCKATGKVINVNAHQIIFLEDCDDGSGTKVMFGKDYGRQVKEERNHISDKIKILFAE